MCFSAQASFITASGLSILSLLSIKKVRDNKKIGLAATPLIFGLQQACEGFVWVTMQNGDTTSLLHKMGMYGFLFFAGTWWPMWIPLVLSIPEKIHKRRKTLLVLLVVGVITGIIHFCAWTLQTTSTEIVNHHINYPVENYPFSIQNKYIALGLTYLIALMYCTTTVLPLFVSSIRYTKLLGVILSIWLLVSYVFYSMAFPSVWCFFAAVSSIIIYFIV
jgi:hypothetical protein